MTIPVEKIVPSAWVKFADAPAPSHEEQFLVQLRRHIDAVKRFGKFLGVPPAQLEVHDMSKLSLSEFSAYAQHFFGSPSKQDDRDFEAAWLHHIHHNPHHWEHWVMPSGPWVAGEDGICRPAPSAVFVMPRNYALEMVADWAGASFAYTGSWDMSDWLEKNLPRIVVHPETAGYLNEVLRHLNYSSRLALDKC